MPNDVEALEAAIVKKTQTECAREVDLIERFLNYVGDGFNGLPRPLTRDDERVEAVLLLSTLGYNSLRWSWELLLKGYYAQAITLSRTAWEAWLHGAYVNLYPAVALESWRDFNQRPKPWKIRELVARRAGEIAPTLNVRDFQADMDQLYSGYSDLSHPSDTTTKILLARRDGEPYLRLGPDFDETLVLMATNFFCTAAGMLSTLFYLLSPADVHYQESGNALRGELREWRATGIPSAT